MRLWKFVASLVLLVSFSFSVHANSPECLVSFDGAKLDVCTGEWEFVNEDLRFLADEAVFRDSEIRVVKFDRPVGASDRAALEDIGAEILGYVPYFGYKIRMGAQLDSQALAIDSVIWVGPYYPVWKIGTNLANEVRDGRFSESPDLNQLHVTLHRGVHGALARGFVEAVPGLEIIAMESVPDHDYLIVEFDRSRVGNIVEDLAVNPDIDAISLRFPNDLLNSQGVWLHQSGEGDPARVPLFDQGLFGCGQTIGFLDSGLAHSHCSFEDPDPDNNFPFDNCTAGPACDSIAASDEHRKIGAFYNWHTQSSTPGDLGNHGTAVVGNAVGSNWANPVDCSDPTGPGNMADVDGMAPGARVIMQEAANNLEYLNTLGGNLYHAAVTAFESGAFIHNNSWGSGCRTIFGCVADCIVEYRENSRFGDMAVWENPELFIFAAAGNSGGGDGNAGCGLGADVGSPGNAKNVFGIGGTQRGFSGNNTYMSSSRGPASDRRTKPDILAQSQAVQTSDSATSCGARSATGTSFGSPTAAGFGALVREYLQRGFYPLGIETEVNAIEAPSAALMRAIMTNSAVQITGQGSGTGYPNQNIGWGSLLADNALYFDGDDRRLWLHDENDGLQTGETHSFDVSTGDGESLIVTLIWHDYFAELNADPHIVNMLRLEVEAPNGDVWTQKLPPGGGLADVNPFQATTEVDYDDRNTVHQIILDNPESGTYQIRVVGIQVAMGDAQPYAVVATGDLLGIGDPDFILQRSPASQAVCSAEDADFEIGVFSVSEFEDDVTLSVSDGLPAGASADFSVNPVTPADPSATSVLTIGDTDAVAAGTYQIEVTGQSNGPEFDPITKSILMTLTVDEDLSGPTLIAPADGAIGVVLRPNVQWEAVAGAVEYEFQIDTDSGFSDPLSLLVEEPGLTPDFDLETGTDYFWRVRALNACGNGEWSTTFEFQTRFQPVAELTPDALQFEVTLGDTDNATLDISNIGTGDLVWSIDLDAPESGEAAPRFGGVFAPENWELVNEPSGVNGSVDIDLGPPVEIFVIGGDDDVGGHTDFQIEIPADGVITFDWGYQSTDTGCFDSGGYAINGNYVQLACNSSPVPYFEETETVEVQAGDIFAFRVATDDGEFGAGILGVTNFQFEGSVCEAPAGVPWLSVDPDSGSVFASNTQSVDVSVDTDGLADGVYEAVLCVNTNAQDQELLIVPVELSVVDPDLALVEGSVASLGVCSDEIGPLAEALVTVEGANNTFTTETDSGGNFFLQINIGENPVDITVSAPFHADESETGVNLIGGQTNSFEFSLEGDSACAEVTPGQIEESAGLGQTVQAEIQIGNFGQQPLDWIIGYTDGGGPSSTGSTRGSASGGLVSGDIATPSREDEELGIQGERVASLTRAESLYQGAARRSLIDEGVLLMPDSGNDRVVAMDPETGDILDLNFLPSILDVGVPVQIILHPDGQRFLLTRQAGAAGGVVEEYDLDGEFTGIFAPVGGQDTSIMQNIRGLAVHPATGNILVTVAGTNDTDPENRDSVLEFAQDGELLGRFIESGAGGLSGPWSIIFRDNDVIVSDSGGDALRVYDWDGEFIEIFTEDPNFPQQIIEGPAGTILAAGFSNPSGAWEWDADGEQIGLYSPETGLRGIHELPNGNILVTNTPGIHEIDRDGAFVRTLETDVTGRFISLVQGSLTCDPVAPGWLSVDQGSGSTDPGTSDTITATLDTEGLQLGQYSAQICVESNDPISPVIPVNVTFNVELGDDFGIVEGSVSSLGFCGEAGFPAAGAQVELVGSDQTFIVTADDNGFYQALVPSADGPYEVTASAPDHFSDTESNVVVTGGDTVVVDFALESDVPCIDVDPLEIIAEIETGGSGSATFDITNTGTADLEWLIDTGVRAARDSSEPLIGFNFTTSGAAAPDPQNWTRISAIDGFIENVPDDTGEPTDINFQWGGVSTAGPLYLGTATLGVNAVPQHAYDLSGMTGYGFRSNGDFFIELTGLQPNAAYEYWMVAYRATSGIDNVVTVSEGSDPSGIQFTQFLAAGDNDGRFVINETNATGDMIWDEMSFITEADSDGTIRITWEGDTQTTVIGAFAIRPALSCDIPDWLTVDPVSGSVADGGTDIVTASFDGTGLAPGSYEAGICVESNDPTTPVQPVLVNLDVVLPADVATLEGQVQSLGYCNDDPQLVEGALVTATSADETFTTTTDENGFYQFFIQEDESPVDIEVTAPAHLPGFEAGITFIGGDVVVTDFDLLLEAPCATVDPGSFLFELSDDDNETQTLTLGNLEGNADLIWAAELEPVTDSRAHFPTTPRMAGFPSSGEVSTGLDPESELVNVEPGAILLQDFDVPAYSTTGFTVVGYIGMDALVPGDLTVIDPDQPTTVFAGTFVGDDMSQQYMLASPGGSLAANTMITIDVETGDVDELGQVTGGLSGESWNSMAWDPATGNIIALQGGDTLFEIDLGSLEASEIGILSGPDVSGLTVAIALAPNGLLYGLNITDNVLLAIDKETADAAVVGDLGFNPNFAQDMDFDPTDGTLYWAGYFGGGDSRMMTIDLATGAATEIGPIEGGSELLSFAIALPRIVGCEEPGDVSWLEINPTEGTTAAGTSTQIDVTASASGQEFGTLQANICLGTNDVQRSQIIVPVTLEVGLPAGSGALEGVVQSLGYCSADPSLVEGALVTVTGQTETFTTTTDENGFYSIVLSDDQSPVDVEVTAPDHLAGIEQGVVIESGETTGLDFDLLLDSACATVDPTSFSFSLEPGDTVSDTLTIGNVDGAAALVWDIETATGESSAPAVQSSIVVRDHGGQGTAGPGVGSGRPDAAFSLFNAIDGELPTVSGLAPAGGFDCDNAEGLIIHDDGEIDNGYSGNPDVVSQVTVVEGFVPDEQSQLGTVCVSLLSLGPDTLNFELVVFDSDGPGGAPGTELAAVNATATGIPSGIPDTPVWYTVDLTDQDIVVESGRVFIGLRWTPSTPNVFVASDEEGPGADIGYFRGDSNAWDQLGVDVFPDYSALFVRPQFFDADAPDPGSCDNPGEVSWLNVTPEDGTAAAGDSSDVAVDIDTAGLAPGAYAALICVNTNDTFAELLQVPVTITIEGDPEVPVANITPDSFEFQVMANGSDSDTLMIGNIGTGLLSWNVEATAVNGANAYGLAGQAVVLEPSGTVEAALQRGGDTVAVPLYFDGSAMAAPQGGPIDGDFDEGFEDITQLPGLGWALINNSTNLGPVPDWTQGGPFPAHEGPTDSSIHSSFNAVGSGDLSQWLITPEIVLQEGTEIRFWTRTTEQFQDFNDRLEVRMSTAGGSTDVGIAPADVGDFDELLLSINPDLQAGVYPEVWTEFVITVEGLSEATSGRIAFRHWVPDAGGAGSNGDNIGIDTFSVQQPGNGGPPPPVDCENPADVDWLSVDPTSGSTDAGETSDVSVLVDATGLPAGNYNALLCVSTNDPDAELVEVPVSLQVIEDVDTATVQGTVLSQGYCSADPFPAGGAEILIEGQFDSYTVIADENGFFSIEVDADESPVDITASAPDHVSETVFDVTLEAGAAVTVDFDLVLEAPCATVNPEAVSITLFDDAIQESPLFIGNVDGAADLVWTISQELRTVSSDDLARFGIDEQSFRGAFNPDLDEVLEVPDFTVVSPANGGSPISFDIEAGLSSSGSVIGFTFEGTVNGVGGGGTWASDLRMIITSPAGESFDVGGLIGVENAWEFQGVGSTDDGTYISVHIEADDGGPVFVEGGTGDAGEWTLSFAHDWDSTSAADMDWSDVNVTLHKTGDSGPVECTDPENVPWMQVFPDAGVTAAGEQTEAAVRLSSHELSTGDYGALLCLISNDPENDIIPIPVLLRVRGDALFSDRFEEGAELQQKIELQRQD